MKHLLATCVLAFCVAPMFAQQRTIVYEKTINLHATIQNEEMKAFVPPTRSTKHELLVADSVTLYKAIIDTQGEAFEQGDGRMRRLNFGGGGDDEVYYNTQSKIRVRGTEFFGDPYVVTDTVTRLKWKLTDETKTILNHSCKKAILISTVARNATFSQFRMNRSRPDSANTSQVRRDTTTRVDTTIAWFATDLPVSSGPEVFSGLPGLIMELEMARGSVKILAIEEKNEVAVKKIKAPTKGKKLSSAEYTDEIQKKMEELNQRGGGRNMRIQL
ncbi:MAG: GLPGLI family protein [Bacteroidetes bacterium]|nr:MAG: GLPGLI family protein [Bacteroidota bacterium]TAE72823.1 MAG: GLPGLI family protein [Bacteroidota bacterium]TAF89930.1 MAG: GLPGLI family protein [Bacteroidota bacterium]